MRIVVTGARGMLGSDVCNVIGGHQKIFPFDVDDFDIVDQKSTREKILEKSPDFIVHCAAYTDVDRAEEEEERTSAVNGMGARNVALVSRQLDIPMLYVSTDYVFDGKKSSPYLENDRPTPLNVYGKAKLAGEQHVRNLLTRFYIVRTAWLYGKNGTNFIYKILKASGLPHDSANQNELPVIHDQIGNPTYTLDLAKALDRLIESECYGTYHITNSGFCSWYQLAKKVFEILSIEVKLKPIDSDSFDQAAKRPRFSALENLAWREAFDNELRPWEDALKDFLSSISDAH